MLNKQIFLILYLISGFTAALCLPASGKDGILLAVKSPSGQALSEVRVFDRSNGDSQTDVRGEIQLARPGKVIFLQYQGYLPHILLTEGLSGRVEVILKDAANAELLLPFCQAHAKSRKAIWGKLRASLPEGVQVRSGADIDYLGQTVFYGVGKKEWLYGIDGPLASNGFPHDKWILTAREFSIRSWRPHNSKFGGVDIRGRSTEGKYWRYFGRLGTEIGYYNGSKEAALFFDNILDGLCIEQ